MRTRPCGSWASYGDRVDDRIGVPDWRRDLLTDPQTSGGLLIAVAPEAAEAVLALVRGRGFAQATIVGALAAGEPRISVADRAGP